MHPPILIGGGERYTLRCLAEMGDACNLFGDFDTVRHKLDVLRGHCEELGRDYGEILKTKYEVYLIRETRSEIEAIPDAGRIGEGGSGLAGSVDEVIERIRQWEREGIEYITLSVAGNDAESRHLLAEKILPACTA